MASNSSAGNGAIQSPSLGPTANPTFESQGQQPPLTKPNAPVSEETKAQILGNSNETSTADAGTASKGTKEGGKGAAEHEAGSSKEEQGAAKEEGWGEEVKDFERGMAGGGH